MQIPQDGKEDILPRKGVGVFLVKEGKVVILIVRGHNRDLLVRVQICHNGEISGGESSKGGYRRQNSSKLPI